MDRAFRKFCRHLCLHVAQPFGIALNLPVEDLSHLLSGDILLLSKYLQLSLFGKDHFSTGCVFFPDRFFLCEPVNRVPCLPVSAG